jgi:hypothetical protein
MSLNNKDLSHICPFKLNETYHTLYEKQYALGISDEYLLNTVRSTSQDDVSRSDLLELLKAYRSARDNILTWYLRQTLVELNVTISLLTAKIKFIEYKLGLCDGLDLHQACSLSLVDFCNILADLTVIKTSPSQRKTIHKVSAEVNIPVWLSHYRNQICHVPSEAPCISILVPLVQKSLQYMKDSFWSKILEREAFDVKRFKEIISYMSQLTHVTCTSKRIQLKKDAELGKKRLRLADKNLDKYTKVCLSFRRCLLQNPKRALDVLTRSMISSKYDDKTRNSNLLLVQLMYAKCFEQFAFKLISLVEQNPANERIISWLKPIISLIGSKDSEHLKENMSNLGILATGAAKFIDVPPVKCCQMAYRLMKLDGPIYRALLAKLRYKLLPILGKKRVMLLIKMTAIIAHNPK